MLPVPLGTPSVQTVLGGGGGEGGCNVFLTCYAISNISRKKSGSTKQWESISNIYITKLVVLVSEPVCGRSRATELPCFFFCGVIVIQTSMASLAALALAMRRI